MLVLETFDSSKLDVIALHNEAASLRACPDYPRVLRDYTLALVSFRSDPRVFNKLISQDARFRIVSHLLLLHAEKVLAGGKGGVTYGEMLDLCVLHPDIGLRVLKTVLPLLSLTGYAHVSRDPHDRRVKIYTPSEKLFAMVDARLAPIIAALEVLQPHIPRAALLREHPLYRMRGIQANGRVLLTGGLHSGALLDFTEFAGCREGAAQVIYVAMLTDMDGSHLPSTATIAKRFGLSKTQVWFVLTECERHGYLARDDHAVFQATDKLRNIYSEWTAVELAFSANVLSPM